MDMTALMQALIGAGMGALGAYVAIRSDLANLQARVKVIEERSDKAHDRIDTILQK